MRTRTYVETKQLYQIRPSYSDDVTAAGDGMTRLPFAPLEQQRRAALLPPTPTPTQLLCVREQQRPAAVAAAAGLPRRRRLGARGRRGR